MSFSEFAASIQSDNLRQVALHWNEVRGARTVAAWANINPAKIAAQLKLIWVYRYDRESRTFTGRLAGNAIETVFGKSFRGTPMQELYREFDYERLFARSERVVREPAFFRGQGMVFHHLERIGQGERIILPLGDDGITGDGILGATTYEMTSGAPSASDHEDESWFAL